MVDSYRRAAAPDLLHYRPWRGTFRPPLASVWPIARVSLSMLFRRRLFWVLYALGSIIFLMFFFGQYLMAWAATQTTEAEVRVGGLGRANPRDLVNVFSNLLKLNGSEDTFRNFFWYQGYILMVVLALAGSLLIGNDLRYGSLTYYFSKPLSRRHYLLGKGLAVAVVINLLTTVPALLLFVQYGTITDEPYFGPKGHLVLGILGYGAVVTMTLTLLLLATATWLRRTVPLIMTWTTIFVLCRLLAAALVDGLHLDPTWRLIDLWNVLWVVGSGCLGVDSTRLNPQPQPPTLVAVYVLAGVCAACLTYLILRIRGVEIVR